MPQPTIADLRVVIATLTERIDATRTEVRQLGEQLSAEVQRREGERSTIRTSRVMILVAVIGAVGAVIGGLITAFVTHWLAKPP